MKFMRLRKLGQSPHTSSRFLHELWPLLAVLLSAAGPALFAQTPDQSAVSVQIRTLTDMLARTQAQLEESQHQLNAMRQQIDALQRSMAITSPASTAVTASPQMESSSTSTPTVEDLRERQTLQDAQIATHEQSKVESASKYPVRITGLMLFNGFVNTRQTNSPATPTIALRGPGSTGATVRQTVLGFDARGPHLFGAYSFADLRVDFAGSAQSSSDANAFAGAYASNTALLRLRTAHAALRWQHTEAFFALDRPILAPDSPTSLAAVAEPALAWSGNLWTWNPQLGITRDQPLTPTSGMRLQAAVIDIADAPLTPQLSTAANGAAPVPASEQSRWPGVESHIAFFHTRSSDSEDHIGIGGYFSPHHIGSGPNFAGKSYDSWAATLDANLHLPARFVFTGSAYRGLAMGGLGAGAYKDIGYKESEDAYYYIRPLDNVGGWAQLKEQFSSRFELNAAFGIDTDFAHQLRRYAAPSGTIYQNLLATRTTTGNFIWSPTASLLFSIEYRHLSSSPITGPSATTNIFGIAAGYKF